MSAPQAGGVVLVTGATGPQGGAVVRALLASGRRVRALTRNPASAPARELASLGAEIVAGDLLEVESLIGPMHDVAAVYGVTTPFGDGPEAEIAQGMNIIDAAGLSQLSWLVLASVASASETSIPHFASKWKIETRLRASALPYTIVAPTYFYENLGDPRQIIAEGQLALPLPVSRPLQQVSLADLGAFVTSLLNRRQEFLDQRVEVAGDQPNPGQMVSALSEAGDRTVTYSQIPIEDISERSSDLAAMYRFLTDRGYGVNIDVLRSTFHEVPWTSFGEWVKAAAR